MGNRYPRVEINLKYLKENVEQIVKRCGEYGIDIAGVIKGTTGIPECAQAYVDGGAKFIASSRLEQLQDAKDFGITLPFLLLRVPMLSELSEVVGLVDISLNSEVSVLKALDAEAGKQGKKHKVIIMADLGDLREGFWDKEEMVDVAVMVENELKNLELAGVGTNLGCYGSIEATADKLDELVVIAENIEAKIGRKLEFISGGATTSLPRIINGDMPKRVNLLRVGEGILLARDLDVFYGYDMSFMHQDVYTLKAEVIEVKDKPSHPVGRISIDAFGHTPEYVDRGVRRRALLGIGKVDYGSIDEIFPKDKGIEVIGASSDHTILDIEDAERDLKVGDIVSFGINYASMVYVTNCRNVRIVFV
ncbi:MAG TPA: alanine/ornithine racemase family PLP-dependent enzyme [Anaerovoracaceae bacterium]|nr:alanine/ornithine racemase family PLP-dependent enzyme [Anaerovoracaceae bacterium]